jgi:hypothetical protein
MKILHPIRPGLPATLLLFMKQDPGGETVGAESQRVKGRSMFIPGVEGLHDEVARSVSSLALVDMERDLVGSRSLIALRIGGVHVSLEEVGQVLLALYFDTLQPPDGLVQDGRDSWAGGDVGDVVAGDLSLSKHLNRVLTGRRTDRNIAIEAMVGRVLWHIEIPLQLLIIRSDVTR